nr:MAG: putative RNA-dependent RNA polymerase [Narnaviridae sp.]
MFPQKKEPLRSLDAEHHNQTTMSFGKLSRSFQRSWETKTVGNVRGLWIPSKPSRKSIEIYAEIRCADIGTTLDTHPLEDVYKAVKIISQYAEMTHSYACLLDSNVYNTVNRKKYSDALHAITNQEEILELVGFVAGLNSKGLLEKYCKWATASLWAWALRQSELPPQPVFMQNPLCQKYSLLFVNKQWRSRFSRCKISRRSELFLASFFKDLYNCKGAAAAVGPEFIEQALKTHKEILTTPKTAPVPIGDESEIYDVDSDFLLSAITETAEQIFGEVDPKRKANAKCPSRFPSLNSSYNSGRREGGAGGEILRDCGDTGDYYMLQPSEGYFYGFATHKVNYLEVRTPYDPIVWEEAELESERRAVAKALNGVGVFAQVIPLSEPFKVRTITKGDSDMYHLARRWQKVIHNKMRKQFNSSLMGQPCNAGYLSQVFYNSPHFDFKNQKGFFVSGDYESATDLLNPQLSLWAQNEISTRLRVPIEHQKVLNACLTEHKLYYGEKDEAGNKKLHDQTWGQLMGSPTSFPVLCLINLAATKLAYELYHREMQKDGRELMRFKINELPMCVNGDDILFWCHSERHYQIWKDVTANAGLKFSLGKNYTSRRFCIINSEMYEHVSTDFLPFAKVPCINTRLIEGGNRSSVTTVFPLHSDDSKELLNDPLFDRSKHLRRFCKDSPGKSAFACLQARYKDQTERMNVWQDYARWFHTIEPRRAVLHYQASAAPKTNKGATTIEQLREVETIKICNKRFQEVQMRRLNEFRALLSEQLGASMSYSLPQSLGGYGFHKRADYKYTVNDLKIVTLSHLQPKLFKRALAAAAPTPAKSGFMKAVGQELSFLSKWLEIEKVYEIQQYSSYQVVDNSFFELSILSGFLSTTNLTVDIDEKESAYESYYRSFRPVQRQDPGLARHYNALSAGRNKIELKKLEADLKMGKERIEMVLLTQAEDGFKIRCTTPVPKLR